ncbi:MAG: hypothetical protein QM401_04160 [Bacillota bacterium]|nr:hypothetical protein [Bacillota bacterium]
MRNTLTDLNNHLFAQMERLSDEDLKGEELQEEIGRAKAVSSIAKDIVSNANTVLKAHEQLNAFSKKDPKQLSRLFLPEP